MLVNVICFGVWCVGIGIMGCAIHNRPKFVLSWCMMIAWIAMAIYYASKILGG